MARKSYGRYSIPGSGKWNGIVARRLVWVRCKYMHLCEHKFAPTIPFRKQDTSSPVQCWKPNYSTNVTSVWTSFWLLLSFLSCTNWGIWAKVASSLEDEIFRWTWASASSPCEGKLIPFLTWVQPCARSRWDEHSYLLWTGSGTGTGRLLRYTMPVLWLQMCTLGSTRYGNLAVHSVWCWKR